MASLLKRQPAILKAKPRLPFIEPLIFLSSTALDCRLSDRAAAGVYRRGQPGAGDDDGLIAALAQGIHGPMQRPVDRQQAQALARGGPDRSRGASVPLAPAGRRL
ncbi:MAG: hypothetical protein P9F75_17800 [Candidatus Contendobacter sp.]|nr:hypothetical protein [Candidatus Contendobacter sp.]